MRRSIAAPAALLLIAICSAAGTARAATSPERRGAQVARACPGGNRWEVFVPAGSYHPFFKTGAKTRTVPVEPLCVNAAPVTHEEFLAFVRAHPQWRKSRITELFAEGTYLADWRDDLTPPPETLSQPVTFVSWFAAGAYCEAHGGRLPTVAEWERMGGGGGQATQPGASDSPFSFAMGQSAPELSATPLEFPGIWEWNADFNSALVSGRIGTAEDANSSLFCGDGFRAVNPSNYAAFLRYSFRSSLRANFALRNLGFRCARELP